MVKRLLILFGFLIVLGGCNENKTNEEMSSAEEEKIKEMQEVMDKETQKLKYDEYMLIKYEEDNNIFLNHQFNKFEDLKEFSYYYPNIKYSEYINDYKLEDISVLDPEEIDIFSLEPDKVYKREILPENIKTITLNYYLQNEPKQVFNIALNKGILGEEYYIDETIEKEMVISNKIYNLRYDLEQKILFGFSFTQEVNNQLYTISISKGEEEVFDFNGKSVTGLKSTLTEQEVENIIHNYNLDEVVKETLNTL